MGNPIIQDIFSLDGVPYSELPSNKKEIVDKAFDNLKEWHDTINSFNNGRKFKLFSTNNPNRHEIESDFPKDLSDKIFSAVIREFEIANSSDSKLNP
jgi:hypothetical protein